MGLEGWYRDPQRSVARVWGLKYDQKGRTLGLLQKELITGEELAWVVGANA